MTGRIAGVDEVGRGPLAGAVVAAAVILDPGRPIPGLADSKALTARRRESLDVLIRRDALAWGIGRAEVEEIDAVNILEATGRAMQRAVAALGVVPQQILVDGNRAPEFAVPVECVVKGDTRIDEIRAASIIAKVYRDAEMADLDASYPGYGLAENKGYGTAGHRAALQRLGPSPCHRRSFEPCRQRELF
ncbi:MAG: ribonuclease HII [Gammaproteobacteria bacterium]|nr:ribonuclease HII [Gammaproteobacteria bacterium]|tara:strand:+ start:2660 stop:3229 length:570 start_codon:yes stop_codon:yes gene_type:complete